MNNAIGTISAAPSGASASVAARSATASAPLVVEPVAVQAQQSARRPAQSASIETIGAIAQRIESYLKSVNRSLEFRVDTASGRTVVSVRDSETGDLIRQIPSDEVLRMAEMAQDQIINLVSETA